MTRREQQFNLKGCSKFVFLNDGGLGYYRFSYDANALQNLSGTAEQGLTPDERIALVGDEWALMRAGMSKAGDYLALGAQFKNTPGYVLLDNFTDHLQFVNDELVSDADRPEMQSWIRQTFSPMLQQMGYTPKASEPPTERQKRAVLFNLLGYLGNDPKVNQQAQTMVQAYMRDPQSVDPTLAGTLLAVAARHGDAELYSQFKAQMKAAKTPEQYYRYFRVLGDFQQPKLIDETLASALTPEVRSQDLYMLPNLMQNPAARQATWDFMRKNYDALSDKTGGGLGGFGIFLGAAEAFCSPDKAQEVQQFFAQHPIQGTERNQKEAIESINSCATLKQQQQGTLSAWLKHNASTSVAGREAKAGNASVQ